MSAHPFLVYVHVYGVNRIPEYYFRVYNQNIKVRTMVFLSI